jgi:hypothetical protein
MEGGRVCAGDRSRGGLREDRRPLPGAAFSASAGSTWFHRDLLAHAGGVVTCLLFLHVIEALVAFVHCDGSQVVETYHKFSKVSALAHLLCKSQYMEYF